MSSTRMFVLLAGVVVAGCGGDELEGTFHIPSALVEYLPDTTITSFAMVDQNGIAEGFYLDNRAWYQTHNTSLSGGNFYIESYGVFYSSTLSAYNFSVVLRALNSYDQPVMEIEWNQQVRFEYEWQTGRINHESGVRAPSLTFLDSLTVNGMMYTDVIEVNYPNQENDKLLSRMHLAKRLGLIGFTTQSGLTYERIPADQ